MSKNQTAKPNKRENTKKIVGIACFSALSFVVSLLEFPVFIAVDFLKLDFSSVFILLAGFMFGPIGAICVSAVKELLRFSLSQTGGIGELANFIITFGLYFIPTLVYRYKKGLKRVIITLSVGCVLQTVLSVISNRFIMLPLYMGSGAKPFFDSVWYLIVAFNLIKSVAVSFLTVILYKRVSYLFKRI